MAPSLVVVVREAVLVSATHGGLYLLIHCSIAQWAHSGGVFWLNKYTQYTNWTKKTLISPTVQCWAGLMMTTCFVVNC